jgi:hypothetical protein
MRHALGSCGVAGDRWLLHGGGPCAFVVADFVDLFCPIENFNRCKFKDLISSHLIQTRCKSIPTTVHC